MAKGIIVNDGYPTMVHRRLSDILHRCILPTPHHQYKIRIVNFYTKFSFCKLSILRDTKVISIINKLRNTLMHIIHKPLTRGPPLC